MSSALLTIREDYYTTLTATIQDAQQDHPNKSVILIGDLNAHLRGWYSETTDSSGKLLEHLAMQCSLSIVRSNAPTFCRPGKLSCVDYVLMDNRTNQALLEHRVAD